MRPLAVDDAPKHSAWARYLLDPAGDPPSDPDTYTHTGTYDGIWSSLLEEFRSGDLSSEAFVRRIYAEGREEPGAISVRNDLFLASPAELLELEGAVRRRGRAGRGRGGPGFGFGRRERRSLRARRGRWLSREVSSEGARWG